MRHVSSPTNPAKRKTRHGVKRGGLALVDAIRAGTGVRSVSVKFSESDRGLCDATEQRTFANMRAYCYWAIRDALEPLLGGRKALPAIDELTQDLTAVQ